MARLQLFASIDVVEAHDVVLAEIAADLHLDQFERHLPGIAEPMNAADRDINGFVQGCLGTQIAIRNLRKQPTPKEVNLKAVVMDKTNYQDYETPIERRTCPTLESVSAN